MNTFKLALSNLVVYKSSLTIKHMFFGDNVLGHGVGPCRGPNEIKSPIPMMNFITINYLFNFIFRFIQ